MIWGLSSLADAAVDFNAVRPDGTLSVSRRLVRGMQPDPGDQIELKDSEGNHCVAIVLGGSERALRVTLVQATWAVAPDDYVVGGVTTRYGAIAQSTSTGAPSVVPPRAIQRPDDAPEASLGLPYALRLAS